MSSTKSAPQSLISAALDYTQLFRSLTDAYIVFATDDPHFTILEENEAHEKIALANREKSIGKPVFEVFPDTSEEYISNGVSQLLESFRKVMRTGKPDKMPNLKYDVPGKDGTFTQKYWSLVHYPVKDDAGKVIAICQATKDITESLKTKEELERTQTQLKQTLAGAAIGTWMWDIKKNLVYVDKNFAFLFGGIDSKKAREGLPPTSMVVSVHPDDRERVQVESYAALKQEKPFESEYRTIDGFGEVHWVLARGVIEHDETGEAVRFPGVVIDITERKNAETNLNFLTRASVQFSASMDYRQMLQNIASVVVPNLADWCSVEMLTDDGQLEQAVVVHKDPKKVEWAKALRKKQGAPDMDAPTGVPHVIHTGEPELWPVITDEMLVASAKDEKELDLMRSLGFSSAMIVPMRIDDQIIGAMSFIATESRIHYKPIDLEAAIGLANRAALAVYNANLYQSAKKEIEQREQLQKELEKANDILESRVRERTEALQSTNMSLERSNQELQDFAYVASHDLQEPLRKIQAFGNLLESEYAEQLGEGADYLYRMRNAASRMSTLISDLLAFSRVTTKAKPSERVDLDRVVAGVLSDLESLVADTKGKVEVDELPVVYADPTHMRQLFQNLVGNALKFHKPDTAPKVTISYDESDPTFHVLRVKDNGIGFDQKYADRIFAVFQRLHEREAYEGTGIGLAVCRKIVERYGGTIKAKSAKGKGAEFIIQLPKKRSK